MSYRQQNTQPEHIFVHGRGDWEQEALRRQRNINYVIRIITTSFLVTFGFLRSMYEWFFPSNEEVIALGREIDEYGQEGGVVGLPAELLKRHMHVLGGTGRGKTTLLVNIIIQLILTNRSLVLIDPKGDLIDSILRFIPPNRLQDVILFDPCDTKFPIAWNIFHLVKPEDRSRLAGEILLVIHKLVGNASWGPRLDSLLRFANLALLEYPGATFLDLYYFFTDEAFRHTVLTKVTDTFVEEFWTNTFAGWSPSQQALAINPVLNKLEPFLSHKIARNILGQPNSAFSLREVLDSGKILLIRIPQGLLGADLSSLIGGLFIAKLHMEIISRQNIPLEKRKPAVFIADEFQEVAFETFEETLSLARSYQVACIVANQFMGQLPLLLQQALDHNCAVRLTGHLEGNKHLVEFDLLQDIDQPKYFIRPLLPAQGPSEEIAQSVHSLSRLRYGTELDDVQRQLQLRQSRRVRYAAEFRTQKEQQAEAQQVRQRLPKARQTQTIETNKSATPTAAGVPQQKTPSVRSAGTQKPSVMKHATKQTIPTPKTQTNTKRKRSRNGDNAP